MDFFSVYIWIDPLLWGKRCNVKRYTEALPMTKQAISQEMHCLLHLFMSELWGVQEGRHHGHQSSDSMRCSSILAPRCWRAPSINTVTSLHLYLRNAVSNSVSTESWCLSMQLPQKCWPAFGPGPQLYPTWLYISRSKSMNSHLSSVWLFTWMLFCYWTATEYFKYLHKSSCFLLPASFLQNEAMFTEGHTHLMPGNASGYFTVSMLLLALIVGLYLLAGHSVSTILCIWVVWSSVTCFIAVYCISILEGMAVAVALSWQNHTVLELWMSFQHVCALHY